MMMPHCRSTFFFVMVFVQWMFIDSGDCHIRRIWYAFVSFYQSNRCRMLTRKSMEVKISINLKFRVHLFASNDQNTNRLTNDMKSISDVISPYYYLFRWKMIMNRIFVYNIKRFSMAMRFIILCGVYWYCDSKRSHGNVFSVHILF